MSWFRNPARTFFKEEEGRAIVDAIQEAEAHTSGEIRVHLDNRIPKGMDIMQRAAEVFQQLGMDETVQRNGVLILFAVQDKRFSIFADEGINKVVPEGFWDGIATTLKEHFIRKQFVEGLKAGIPLIGAQLQEYFPREEDDQNELPDELSFG